MDIDLSWLIKIFYAPPSIPDLNIGLLARWTGGEEMAKELLVQFYGQGFKDGFVAAVALAAVAFLVYELYRSRKGATK